MRKFSSYTSLLIFFFYISAIACFSSEPNDLDLIIKSHEKMQRSHEAEKEILERQRKEKNLEKEVFDLRLDENSTDANSSGKLSDFLITEIILENSTILKKSEKEKLISDYINKKLSIKDIKALMADITNFYIKSGYPTARVRIIPGQKLQDGTLRLLIVEGFIEEIVMGDQTFKDRMKIFTAFPFLTGKKFRLNDIEQGIEQFNRLTSNNAVMKFEHGEKEGGSKIIIENQPKDTFRADLGLDNAGEKSTGEIRRKLTLNKDNLIGINDNFIFVYTEDNQYDNDNRFSRYYYGGFSFPLGYWTFSGDYSYSEYMMTVKGLSSFFKTSGNSESGSFKIEKVLLRDNASKTSVNSSITLKSTESYLEDIKTDTSSRKLSVLRAEISHNRRIFGGICSFDFSYYKGLKNFAAKEDPPDIPFDNPKAQFEKYGLDIGYYKPIRIFYQNAVYRMNFSSQYSEDVLFGSEKISIGGSHTVRGFKKDSIQGDNGVFLKNEFAFIKPDVRIFEGLLSHSEIFLGIDTGYVRETAGITSNLGEGKGGLTGWACGLKFGNDTLSFDFTYSEPIYSPYFIEKNDFEIYFSITLGLDNIYNSILKHIFGQG